MKASELRIGNLVEYKNQYIKVSGIGPFGIQSESKEYLIIAKFSTPDIQPIPLNEEWLIKFGFSCEVKIGGDGVEFRVYHFNVLTFNTNHGWWYKVQRMNDTPLQYVHQLQNF